MKGKVLLAILVVSLASVWGSAATAGQIVYSMRSAETGFVPKPSTAPPSSAVMIADALIGRPLGLATTIASTGVGLVVLPFRHISGASGEAAVWGLMGRPAGWTFMRPLGRGEPFYEERGVFQSEPAPRLGR